MLRGFQNPSEISKAQQAFEILTRVLKHYVEYGNELFDGFYYSWSLVIPCVVDFLNAYRCSLGGIFNKPFTKWIRLFIRLSWRHVWVSHTEEPYLKYPNNKCVASEPLFHGHRINYRPQPRNKIAYSDWTNPVGVPRWYERAIISP
jgi:hypothetical protein